jgi:hypothetical protein
VQLLTKLQLVIDLTATKVLSRVAAQARLARADKAIEQDSVMSPVVKGFGCRPLDGGTARACGRRPKASQKLT